MGVLRRATPSGLTLSVVASCLAAGRAGAAPEPAATPAGGAQGQKFAWTTATPESQGMSSARLAALVEQVAGRGTKALLVARRDRIVAEWYAPDSGRQVVHRTASLAKAIVGGLSLALAMADGRIKLDDRVSTYVPAWKKDRRKREITVRQLGSHTSGLEDAERDGQAHEKLTGWKGDFWKRLPAPKDPFTISRDKTPLVSRPGKRYGYSNPGIAMLTYAVTASLRNADPKDVRGLLRERIFGPLGVPEEESTLGYGQTFVVNGLPLVGAWGGGNFSPDALARLGRLLLRRGDWDGSRLVPELALALVTGDAGTPGNGGQGFWSNAEGVVAGLPRDAFWGAGAGHQVLLVVPSWELLLVRNGEHLEPGTDYFAALYKHLFERIAATLGEPPVPASSK